MNSVSMNSVRNNASINGANVKGVSMTTVRGGAGLPAPITRVGSLLGITKT